MKPQVWDDTFSAKADPRKTPQEWYITDCERVKHNTNEDLWLRPEDGDSHNPIIIRLTDFRKEPKRPKT